MLGHLHIRDFAIVPNLEISLRGGLTVLTGETGAGKSIMIDALALVLGQRADHRVIRAGCRRAEITASFDLDSASDAARWLADNDLFADGECIVRRIIEIDRPTKGFINGRPVTMQMVRELGDALVDIHGQHEHQSLMKRDIQRQVLDDYVGIGDEVRQLGAHYRSWHELTARLDNLRRQEADQAARLELLKFQVDELGRLDLKPDEIAGLEDEHRRLANGAEILEGVQAIAYQLYDADEGAVSSVVGHAMQKLEELAEHDARLGEIAGLLSEAVIQIDEAASGLHNYADSLDLDPGRLGYLDERLGLISDLARKHHVEAEMLPEVYERLATELGDIEDFDNNLERLEREIRQAASDYDALAATVSTARTDAAARLGSSVSARMQELGMAGGVFEVSLAPLAEGERSAGGLERIEFLVSANLGQPVMALNKVASGGELSRISLALQVITASVGRVPTLIFDEVDVGIGGRVAELVGHYLRELGRSHQVLCITHQAQVAAQGEHHLQVAKSTDGESTTTRIHTLGTNERVEEIARMIGGIEISQQTLDHAADMLNRAAGQTA